MDILGTLSEAVASAASGGIFGLVGHVATKLAGYFESEQQFKQKLAEWAHENELLKLQMQAKAAETENEMDLAGATGAWSGLGESLKAETAIGTTYPWVNAVRALVRPALTLGLALFLCSAFFALPADDETRAYVANSLVFAAVTAIVWWFGDRAPKRAPH